MITFLSGGTGTPKLIDGFRKILKDTDIAVIANTADNFWVYGLYVAPDVDTVMYLFANLLDKKRYWGIKRDTFKTMDIIKRVSKESWFNIGDKDLSIHLARTHLLNMGLSLSSITKRLCHTFNVKAEVIPATEEHMETRIVTENGVDLHFQEFWVKYKGNVDVKKVYFKNLETVTVPQRALKLLEESDLIIIGPSNPVTSIGPIINLLPIRDRLKKNRDKCIAVSPIIGNQPVSGPAGKLMKAINVESTAEGVAELYSEFIGLLVIDHRDTGLQTKIEKKYDIKVFTANIFFRNSRDAASLAKKILKVTYNEKISG